MRLGSLHRNTFINSPRLLRPTLQLVSRPRTVLRRAAHRRRGLRRVGGRGPARRRSTPRGWCAGVPLRGAAGDHGARLAARTTSPTRRRRDFQPMNANYGLFPPLGGRARGREKQLQLARARARRLRALGRRLRTRAPRPRVHRSTRERRPSRGSARVTVAWSVVARAGSLAARMACPLRRSSRRRCRRSRRVARARGRGVARRGRARRGAQSPRRRAGPGARRCGPRPRPRRRARCARRGGGGSHGRRGARDAARREQLDGALADGGAGRLAGRACR